MTTVMSRHSQGSLSSQVVLKLREYATSLLKGYIGVNNLGLNIFSCSYQKGEYMMYLDISYTLGFDINKKNNG